MTINKKYIVWEPFLLAIMIAIGMLFGGKMTNPGSSSKLSTNAHDVDAVEEILRFIDSKYVDSTDREFLTRKAIVGILSNLDPHSSYIPPEEVRSIEENMAGEYFGVGIKLIESLDSNWMVSEIIANSPAENSEIQIGYILKAIDSINIDVQSHNHISIENLVRGDDNTTVELIFNNADNETILVSLKRTKIPLLSVQFSALYNDSIGLIRIDRFSERTYTEFMQALEELKSQGLDDLIIDVRSNPGGYLQETVKIISQFIPEKEALLVYTEGENSKRLDYTSNGRIFHDVDDLVIIIDENSASASEILAGALQDLDRALIVGRRSFGKGLVQEQYNLHNGGAIRLTTARYYTPSGRLIQKNYSDLEDYNEDLPTRFQNGEYQEEDLVLILDSTEHFTSTGRVVYGGGGIIPDVFVPDANPFTYSEWPRVKRWIQQYTVEYFLDIKGDLPELDSDYLENFILPQNYFEELITNLSLAIPHISLQSKTKDEFLRRIVKTQLALLHFDGKDVYYSSLYKNSSMMERAIEYIVGNKVDDYLNL